MSSEAALPAVAVMIRCWAHHICRGMYLQQPSQFDEDVQKKEDQFLKDMVENKGLNQLAKGSWGKEPFETRRETRGEDERQEVAVLHVFTHAVNIVKLSRNTLSKE